MDQWEASILRDFLASMPLFILVCRHYGQATSNLRGTIRSDKKMPRRPECSISTHVVRNKLHFRFVEGHYPKPFAKRHWH
jgi:hypothetical protein